MCKVTKAGAPWQEVVYRPVVLREQTWQLQIPEPQASALPRGESSAFPSFQQPLSLCWCLGPKGVGRGLTGPSVQVWLSIAPEHEKTSVEGTLPLAPTGLAPGIYRAREAQLWPVCPL